MGGQRSQYIAKLWPDMQNMQTMQNMQNMRNPHTTCLESAPGGYVNACNARWLSNRRAWPVNGSTNSIDFASNCRGRA